MKKTSLYLDDTPLNGNSGIMQIMKEGGAAILPAQWRRYGLVIVAVASVVVLALLWKMAFRPAYFPRRESEFLTNEALDRRLEGTAQRLKADPDDIGAMTESGVLLFQKGKDFYPDAINYLNDAWEHGALDSRIFYYMGVMYQEEGLYRDAIRQYMMFLRNHPKDEEVRLLLAKLLYQSAQFEDAVTQYHELQQKRPHDAAVIENLALSLQALKRYDDAKSEMKTLANLGPIEERRSHFYLGQIAYDQNDYRETMRQFMAVLPLEGNPDIGISQLTIYSAVAENYDKLKAPAMAKDAWEKVVLLDPQNSHAKSRVRALNSILNRNRKKSGRSKKK